MKDTIDGIGWSFCEGQDESDAHLLDVSRQQCDVVDLDVHRPHRALEVICVKCCDRWIAVAPADTPLKFYECKTCGPGAVISTGQSDV